MFTEVTKFVFGWTTGDCNLAMLTHQGAITFVKRDFEFKGVK